MAAWSWEASNFIATVASTGASIYQSQQLHARSTSTSNELHFQALAADLLANTKEADRDVWEQRNGQFNNMLVASSVLFGIAMACILEGSFDEDRTEGWEVTLYLVFVALSIGSLFTSFVSSVLVMQRMRFFMINRASLYAHRSARLLAVLESSKKAEGDADFEEMKARYKAAFKKVAADRLPQHHTESDTPPTFYEFYEKECSAYGNRAEQSFYGGAVFVWMSICVLV